MKNIVIVDSHLGFVSWLSCALIAPNRQTWPACSVSDAMVLVVKTATPIDVLIINPSISNASTLIALLRRSQPHLKVIGVGGKGKSLLNIDVWRRKPNRASESAREEWLDSLKNLFSKHILANPGFRRLHFASPAIPPATLITTVSCAGEFGQARNYQHEPVPLPYRGAEISRTASLAEDSLALHSAERDRVLVPQAQTTNS